MVEAKTEIKKYPTEPFKCWQKAKELRDTFYREFVTAHELGGLRVAGSGATALAICNGLGWDIYFNPGEPYGASVGANEKFAIECLEAVEKAGYARDLCAYLRNYWGSAMIGKFLLADGTTVDWPKPDFMFTYHHCCSHAPWYRKANEIEGGDIPLYIYDHPTSYHATPKKKSIDDYLTYQIMDAIPWMEKVTGRKFNDETMIQAIRNECETSYLWGQITSFQKAIPCPMSEKTAYTFHALTSLRPMDPRTVELMKELRDEIQDRVERGIADVPNERYRILHDSNPPWSFLQIFRYLERAYGVISIGGLYTFGLHGAWVIDEKGDLVPYKTPDDLGMPMNTREDAIRAYIDTKQRLFQYFYGTNVESKNVIIVKMAKQWNADAVFIHLNRGCEELALGQMENRLALIEEGIPVMTYEGNMADPREFDLIRTREKIDSFLEGQGLKKFTS
jgi:benzoyl-CoA reductase subunit B